MENQPKNHQEWLKERLNGIGASEAAAIVNCSPYMSNTDLWELKTGRRTAVDISEKPYVRYGNIAEFYLRGLFALDYPQYEVTYDEFKMIRNPDYPFIFATLDGELIEKTSKREGVLEIKTTEIMQSTQWDKWNGGIPDNYYIQVLHQLLATGYDFVILKAQIKWRKDNEINLTTRHYQIERSLAEDDLDYLLREEIKFWEHVKNDERPNTLLPAI